MGRLRALLPLLPSLWALLLSSWLALQSPFPLGRLQPPDEDAHFLYVKWLSEGRGLLVFGEGMPTYEAHQPPLYYAICALPASLIPGHEDAPKAKAARLVSAACGSGAVYASFLLFSRIGGFWEGLFSSSLLSGVPQFLYISSGVGNDPLASLLALLCFLSLLSCLRRPRNVKAHLLLGLSLGSGFLTKGALSLLFPAALFGLLLGRREGLGKRLAFLALSSLPLALPWAARNVALYGDPLASRAFLEQFERLGRPGPEYFLRRGISLSAYLLLVLLLTAKSAFGYFGSMNVPLPLASYALGGLVFLSGLLGWIRGARGLDGPSKLALASYGTFFLLLLASFLRFNMHFFQAQGRYLFPALPLICFLAGRGILRLFGRWGKVCAAVVVALLWAHEVWAFSMLFRLIRLGW